jgi:hypothetical protein
MSWLRDTFGYVAGLMVLGTFSVTSMRPLRLLGIASNFLFISYAIMAGMMPILILHSLLLPMNIYRLTEIERRRQPVLAAAAGGTDTFLSRTNRGPRGRQLASASVKATPGNGLAHVALALAALVVIMSLSTYGEWLLLEGAAPEAAASAGAIGAGQSAGAAPVPIPL